MKKIFVVVLLLVLITVGIFTFNKKEIIFSDTTNNIKSYNMINDPNKESQELKVLAIEINPILYSITDTSLYPNNGGHPKADEWFNEDVEKSINEIKQDVEDASHGYINVSINREYLNEFPTYNKNITLLNGSTARRFSESDYVTLSRSDYNVNRGDYYKFSQTSQFSQVIPYESFDYEYLFNNFNLIERRNSHEFDQVWLFIAPPLGSYETVMVGRNAYWVNGNSIIKDCDNFVIAAFELTRRDTQGHTLGHMAENIINRVYKGTNNGAFYDANVEYNVNSKEDYNELSTWEKFTLNNHNNSNSNYTSVGNVHFPFNGTFDYDYNNSNQVKTNWREWLNFPSVYGEDFSFDNDSVFNNGDINKSILNDNSQNQHSDRLYMRWWFSLFPHVKGLSQDGYSNNWWKYLYSLDYVTSINNNIDKNIRVLINKKINVNYTLNYYSDNTENITIINQGDNVRISNNEVLGYIDGELYAKKVGKSSVTIYHDGNSIEYIVNVVDSNNPIEISSKEELNLLRTNPDDYFILKNDIDLSNVEWEPIDNFTGYLNGNNHIIKNLKITSSTMMPMGFFKNVGFGANISNLIFENIYINGYNYVGSLAGTVSGDNISISNISVLDGYVGANGIEKTCAGGIIGRYIVGNNNTLSNLYNGADIENSNIGGGIIGFWQNENNYNINMINVMNRGNISTNNVGGIIGEINSGKAKIVNGFQLGEVIGKEIVDDIVGIFENGSIVILNNIYHVNNSDLATANNVLQKSTSQIANEDYSNWNDFSNYFKHETIDGIKRIPLLKDVDIEYTKLNEDKIEIGMDEEYNIYDLLDTNNDAVKNITYNILDTSIAMIDNNGIITGKRVGNTKLAIESNYDGFSKVVDIEILNTGVICLSGEYLPDHSIICQKCPEGYYCPTTDFTYTGLEQGKNSCPSGYTSNKGAKSETDCYVNVEAGRYKTNKIGTTTDECRIGSYKESHKSYYNESDSCVVCLNGKTTSGEGKTSCDSNCSNTIGVDAWEIATWNNNTTNNICKIKNCDSKYELENNKCIKKVEIYEFVNGYILDISKMTSLENFKTNIVLESDEEVKIYEKENVELAIDKKIFTGSITKIIKNNEVVKTYINIVLGDTNRDGDMDLSDVAKLYSKVMKNNVEDNLIELSGDANKDNKIDISDVAKIYSYYMNNREL